MNLSPFCAERIVSMDKNGAEILILVVKATYDLPVSSVEPVLAQKQLPLEYADIYQGEPGKSSLRYEADMAMEKTGTDVILVGHAYAKQIGDPYVDVSLRVGKLKKTVRVFGDRHWKTFFGISTISKPLPFQKIPLDYERAFGGIDTSNPNPKKHEYESRNPVGVGFRAKHSKLPVNGIKLPNIEDPKNLINSPKNRPAPTGFGFISKNWKPRMDFQGTYDDNWLKRRSPLLPEDFDKRFNSAASPGLITNDFFVGNEAVEIKNASPTTYINSNIPNVLVVGSLLIDAKLCYMDMRLDTVVINTDSSNLIIVWRGSWNVHNIIEDISWVRAELGKSGSATKTN